MPDQTDAKPGESPILPRPVGEDGIVPPDPDARPAPSADKDPGRTGGGSKGGDADREHDLAHGNDLDTP